LPGCEDILTTTSSNGSKVTMNQKLGTKDAKDRREQVSDRWFFKFLGAGLPFKESFEINCDEIFPEMQIAKHPEFT